MPGKNEVCILRWMGLNYRKREEILIVPPYMITARYWGGNFLIENRLRKRSFFLRLTNEEGMQMEEFKGILFTLKKG